MDYHQDSPSDGLDTVISSAAGPEPSFDAVTREFLWQNYVDLKQRAGAGGLLKFTSLGILVPWLYRLTFSTRGYRRDEDGVAFTDTHVFALRFFPDYLRNANQFAMLHMLEPVDGFHPNISPSGAVCLEIYPGEPLLEICQSIHDLVRWRLCQLDERDALNSIACAWGRDHVTQPIDDRPLFGAPVSIQWQPILNSEGAE